MKHSATLALVALACAATLGCRTPAPAPVEHEPFTLKTYEVPHGYEAQVRALIRGVTDASVEVAPNGKLLVNATPGTHSGIRQLIADLKASAPPADEGPVTLTYWLILGRAPEGKVSDAIVTRGFPERGQKDVLPALQALNASQGPFEFALLERVELVGALDRTLEAQGEWVKIQQRVTRDGGGLSAELSVDADGPPFLQTELQLEPGKFLVLGQTSFDQDRLRPNPFGRLSNQNTMLFYVVRAES